MRSAECNQGCYVGGAVWGVECSHGCYGGVERNTTENLARQMGGELCFHLYIIYGGVNWRGALGDRDKAYHIH